MRRKGSGLGDQGGEKLGGAVTRIRLGRKKENQCVTGSAYECEEASIIVGTDALISERPVVGWVFDDLKARVGTWWRYDLSSLILISPFLGVASTRPYRRIC